MFNLSKTFATHRIKILGTNTIFSTIIGTNNTFFHRLNFVMKLLFFSRNIEPEGLHTLELICVCNSQIIKCRIQFQSLYFFPKAIRIIKVSAVIQRCYACIF